MYTESFIQGYFDHHDKMVLIAKNEKEVAAYFLVQVIDVELPMM